MKNNFIINRIESREKYIVSMILLIVLLFSSSSLFADEDIVNIPDAAFKYALVNHWPRIDTNMDGEIQVSEAEVFDPRPEYGGIEVRNRKMHDATGIKAFKSVAVISFDNTRLETIDIKGMDNLDSFISKSSWLKSVDVSGMENLEYLNVEDNQITDLNVDGCIGLEGLFCGYNQLLEIDISDCINLIKLEVNNNFLSSISLSTIYKLSKLSISNNPISALDISNLFDIYYLYSINNNLTNLTFPKNSDLYVFAGNENKFVDLDLSESPNVVGVYLSNNSLDILNLKNGNNKNFKQIEIMNNQVLKCVDVDNPTYSYENWSDKFDEGIEFSEDCKNSITDGQDILFFVYPNPAYDNITIKRITDSESEIRIIDMTGKLCYKDLIHSGNKEIEIDISKFAIGTYVIEINEESELLIIER